MDFPIHYKQNDMFFSGEREISLAARPLKSWAMDQLPMRWTGYRRAVAFTKLTTLGTWDELGWAWCHGKPR